MRRKDKKKWKNTQLLRYESNKIEEAVTKASDQTPDPNRGA
jgi:hypothetical protein